MTSRKINIAYLATFQKMFLSKDAFLIPYYQAREQNLPLKVIYGSNIGDAELPTNYRGAELIGKSRERVGIMQEFLDWGRHIMPYAKNINSLFFCGCSAHHMLLTWLLLQLNSYITIVVFGDMEEPQAHDFAMTGTVYGKGITAWAKRKLANYFFNHVKFLVANERAYELMEKTYKKYNWHGLIPFHPCLDDELFNDFGLKQKTWQQKENIIISVGRIGNHQKNTDMLLEAILKVDLRDWKIFLIGPITDNFVLNKTSDYNLKIKKFFNKRPDLKDKVIFTGMIYNQKELFNYYIRAKVYVSSARHEGFANVYSQASALGCYIISTDVGGAQTASNDWQFGTKIEQENSGGLAKALQAIIDGKIKIDLSKAIPLEEMSYSYQTKKVLIPQLK